jgi:hypothetical protein
LSGDIAAIRALVPTTVVDSPRELEFVRYAKDATPFAVFTHLHYLRSARPDSLNFALVDRSSRVPIALCSATALDWRRLGSTLHRQYGVPPEQIWDISRVYSFEVAPYNTISMLLGRVRRWFARARPDASLLVTTVDPNMGFTGASYRAANWQEWLTVRPRPYLYLKRRYVSPRQLRQQYGTSNRQELRDELGVRLEVSTAELLDSSIYCSRVRGRTESVPPEYRSRMRR